MAPGSSAPHRASGSGSGSPGRTARARDAKKGQERERSRERDADTGVNRGESALEAADSDSKQDVDMSIFNSASSEGENITAITTANGHKRQAVSAAAADSSANFNSANRFSVLDVEPSGEEDSADDTDLPEPSWKKARASRAAADPRLAELAAAAGEPSEVALDVSELSARLEFISIWVHVSEECTNEALYAFVCQTLGNDMYERFHAEWVACVADKAREQECSQAAVVQHAVQHATPRPDEPLGRALVSTAAKAQATQQRGPGAAALPPAPATGLRKVPAPRPRDGLEAPPTPAPALPQQQRQQPQQQHAGGSPRTTAAKKPTGPAQRVGGGRRCTAATTPGRPKGTGPHPTPFLRSEHTASGRSLLQWRSPGGNGWQVLQGSQQPPPEGWSEWRLRMAAHGRWWLRSGAGGSGADPRGPVTKVAPDARKPGGAVGAAPRASGRGAAPAPGSYAATVAGGIAAANGVVASRVAGGFGGSGGGGCTCGGGGSGCGGGGSSGAPRAPAAVSAEAFAQMQAQLAWLVETLVAQQAGGARSERADRGAATPSTMR